MTDITKEQATKELEKLRKEFDARTKKLEEIINRKESVVWKPEFGAFYYCHTADGVEECRWENDVYDKYRYAIGNCHRTKQEAQDARDARIILTDIQRMADEANGKRIRGKDWCDITASVVYVVYVYYPSYGLCVGTTYSQSSCNLTPCFLSRESAEKAKDALIAKYGEAKVKMALSGVWR